MREPTYTTSREGRRKPSTERQGSTGPAGVLAMACVQEESTGNLGCSRVWCMAQVAVAACQVQSVCVYCGQVGGTQCPSLADGESTCPVDIARGRLHATDALH